MSSGSKKRVLGREYRPRYGSITGSLITVVSKGHSVIFVCAVTEGLWDRGKHPERRGPMDNLDLFHNLAKDQYNIN